MMKTGGQKLARVLAEVLKTAKPGVSLKELDQLAEALLEKTGGRPSFKMVAGYHWATCLNVNQGVVHGIPTDYRLKRGDLLSVDVGLFYQGFHTDMARTISVPGGEREREKKEFLQAGEKALLAAIEAAQPGKRVGHLSAVIETEIKKAGFRPVEVLTGHGVGKELHEEPQIPCFLRERVEKTPLLKPGMTLAVEVIYTQGKPAVVLGDDGWTVETADGRLAGLFEKTIAVTEKGALVLTPYLTCA